MQLSPVILLCQNSTIAKTIPSDDEYTVVSTEGLITVYQCAGTLTVPVTIVVSRLKVHVGQQTRLSAHNGS